MLFEGHDAFPFPPSSSSASSVQPINELATEQKKKNEDSRLYSPGRLRITQLLNCIFQDCPRILATFFVDQSESKEWVKEDVGESARIALPMHLCSAGAICKKSSALL